MPQRQFIITHDSEEVQGEGSWIKLRTTTYGEGKRLRKLQIQIQEELAEVEEKLENGVDEKVKKKLRDQRNAIRERLEQMNEELLVEKIYDWNWVDTEGNPLPKPKDDPSVIEGLTNQELKFIQVQLRGSDEDRKKQDTSSGRGCGRGGGVGLRRGMRNTASAKRSTTAPRRSWTNRTWRRCSCI